ncbi:hypothetical protein N7495_006030 [Penicillium taxi]|uniref:uncharacterized protein n=1 Tax=Penicillium taxi TaxID=168475 RepID=UPI00254514A0|nr:uncharacterized protein N7495_006030 [Penicillium taxi]KAJ5894339.1 hypothetical protein N7495_006030 [Penicillium taxi]
MQRIIQRTVTARKQAQKKVYRAKKAAELVDRKDVLRTRKEYALNVVGALKDAQKARWEDWEKGNLAPKRDSGLEAMTYGAVNQNLVSPPRIPKHLRRKYIPFAEGDRVVIIKGRDTGKINEITQVNRESETVIIKDLNMSDVVLPEWAKLSLGAQGDTIAQPMPVPIDNIRLVPALMDPVTGVTRDKIIQHIYAGKPKINRQNWSKLPRYTRYVGGSDIQIPWPTESAPAEEDLDSDTRGIEVDDITWVPSMQEPPFPSTVIDELRNKYSRFRTRHEPEYVRQKVLEEYRQEYLASQRLLTPRGEKIASQAIQGAAVKKARLDEDGNVIMAKETKEFINQYLSSNQPKSSQSPKKAKKVKA